MCSSDLIIAHPQTGKRHSKEFEHTEEAYSQEILYGNIALMSRLLLYTTESSVKLLDLRRRQ